MSENKVQNATQHNAMSDIGIETSFIKTEQECLEDEYPGRESSFTRDTKDLSFVSSTLNCVDNFSGNMKQTKENISETIIKSEILELHEEFIIKKEEEEASHGHSQLKDIETVYIPTVYKSEELEYVETVAVTEDINKYEKDEAGSTSVMDTEISWTSLKKHSRTDTGLRQYKRHNLKFIEEKQTSGKRFECDQCNKMFSQKCQLIMHKRIHTGEKPYRCEQCDKTFSRGNDLIVHKRTHMGDKPYRCEQCNKMFSQRVHFIVHKRTHTGEKPYQCDQCDKMFSRGSDLIVHKRSHTGEKPFICDQCDKMFSRRFLLIQHKQTHTGEKPFKCDQCDKMFSRRYIVIQHKRTHTGEKPFVCDQCEKMFTYRVQLIRHKRIHTG